MKIPSQPCPPMGEVRRPGPHLWALTVLALLGLYIVGLVHWTWFFYRVFQVFQPGPSAPMVLSVYDWPKEVVNARVFQDAIKEGRIPYHVEYPNGVTGSMRDGRFLGLPDYILTPDILLLALLSPEQFYLAHNFILYSLGFLGSLALWRRYRLDMISFATFFVLFNFNGYITAHMGVGHSMWCGYFLLPFFSLYLLEWLEEPGSLMSALKMAMVLFGMLLQGSLHMVIWCWMFLFLLTISRPRYWRQGLLAVGLSGLMAAFRLLPAALSFRRLDNAFIGGYADLVELVRAFLVIRDPEPVAALDAVRWSRLGWWELDIYMSLLGLLMLVYFGIYQRISPAPDLLPYLYPQLDVPLILLSTLSLNSYYRLIFDLPIPLVNSERATSRFIIIPVVVLLTVASIRLGCVLRRAYPGIQGRVIGWALVCEMFASLIRHSKVWRVPQLEKIEGAHGMPLASSAVIIEVHDPIYKLCIWSSAGLSLLVLAAWVFLYVRFRRARMSKASSEPLLTAGSVLPS